MSGKNSPCHGLASAAAFSVWIRVWQNHILAGQYHCLVYFIIRKPDLALRQPLRLHFKPPYTQKAMFLSPLALEEVCTGSLTWSVSQHSSPRLISPGGFKSKKTP